MTLPRVIVVVLATVTISASAAPQTMPVQSSPYATAPQQALSAPLSGGKSYSQFSAPPQERADRWRNVERRRRLEVAYTLRAGAIIPVILLSAINSDLPGEVRGQVSQNVFDTGTGRYLLIPQGAMLLGAYSSDVTYGQERVLFAWQRITFPDASVLDIGAMPGADGEGQAGLTDQVDNHYWRIFSSAVLLSGITTGFKVALPDDAPTTVNGQPSVRTTAGQALSENLGNTASEMLRRNMNIAPTLRIRKGMRVNVSVVKDLVFDAPYEPLEPELPTAAPQQDDFSR